jgi:hypothetical protein
MNSMIYSKIYYTGFELEVSKVLKDVLKLLKIVKNY